MPLKKRQELLPVWLGLGAAILWTDYVAGPTIALSYLFLVPIALAAHYHGRRWGIALAVVLPLSRFSFRFAWHDSLSLQDSLINTLIRIGVLAGVAWLIDRVSRQAEEIRALRGILPICMDCKKIRTPEQKWEPVEGYITAHSQAQFSHTFCPDCGQRYYGELWQQDPKSDSMAASPETTQKPGP